MKNDDEKQDGCSEAAAPGGVSEQAVEQAAPAEEAKPVEQEAPAPAGQ